MVLFSLKKIGVEVEFDTSKDQTDLIENSLPVELIDGSILEKSKKKRCILNFKNRRIIGGYGILQEIVRIDGKKRLTCFVKYSKEKSLNILNEALLQHVSYVTLKKFSIEYMISKVYDIYKRNDTIFFTMEKIDGVSVLAHILESNSPEKLFIDILIQLCIVLLILKKEVYLDHRDLRYTNLLIVKKSKDIHLEFHDKSKKHEYRLNTQFHICLLDFGFACIGKEETVLNAYEHIFQKTERCLKPGRDMFQIVASLFYLKEFRNKLDTNFLKIVERWFIYKDTDYSNLAKSSYEWSYIITSEESFNYSFFVPENFLNYLYDLRNKYV